MPSDEATAHDRIGRLREAYHWSNQRLKAFRHKRYEALVQLVGRDYSEEGTAERVPLNLIELMTGIFVRQLASRRPRVLITVDDLKLKGEALRLELNLNRLIKHMKLDVALRRIAVDAVFCMGIAKVGLGLVGEDEQPQSFVEPISLDDWTHDMTATRIDQIGFAGNRYRIPLEEARNSGLLDPDEMKKISANVDDDGLLSREDHARNLSQGSHRPEDEYIPHAEFQDVWLPHDGMIVTMRGDMSGKPLRTVNWEGPQNGPFYYLGFSEVPGNVMPLSPVATLKALHDAANGLMNKSIDQAKRLKTILGVTAGSDNDANRISETPDGHATRIDNANAAKELKLGGFNQEVLALGLTLSDQYSKMAGNLDALGGLQAQSSTIGQDEMLLSSASKRVSDMQDRMIELTTDIMSALAWYEWNDPMLERKLMHKVGDTGISIPMDLKREDLIGRFEDYDMNIEPYSMQHQSPSSRLATMTQVYQTFIAPNMELLAAQGMTVDFQEMLRLVARYTDMTELEEIVIFSGQLAGPAGGGQGGGGSAGPQRAPVPSEPMSSVESFQQQLASVTGAAA